MVVQTNFPRRLSGTSRLQRAIPVSALALAAALQVFAVKAQETATAPTAVATPVAKPGAAEAMALLRAPPRIDYATVCRKPSPPLALARDWSEWDGEDTETDPVRMLADVQRYIAGGDQVSRDKPLARAMLEHLASRQTAVSARAKRELALLLLDPEAGAVDPERAERLLIQALAAQEPSAALSLGRLHRAERLPSASPELAARYLGTSAGLGDPQGALEFARLQAIPGATPPFPGAADYYLTLALIGAQSTLLQGDCGIVANVGDFILSLGGDEGSIQAAAWYEVGVLVGDIPSHLKLSQLYASGIGGPKDPAKALALQEKAAALGSIEAGSAVAEAYLTSGRRTDAALKLLKLAIANRDMRGFSLLARYQRGDFTGKPDFDAMRATLTQAASLPGASVSILADQATAMLEGLGERRDPAQAAVVFETLASVDTPEADFEYSQFLLRVASDLPTATQRLRRAAAAGFAPAMMELSETLRCVPAVGTLDEARQWRDRAGAAGNPAALRRLGQLAMEAGRIEEARARFQNAAGMGDRPAMVELAVMLRGSKESDTWAKQAAAPGEGVTAGRLALARAYLRGDLAANPNEAAAILDSVGTMRDGAVDIEIARLELPQAKPGDKAWTDNVERLNQAALSGNSKAMLALRKLGKPAAALTGVQPEEWLVRAAEAGEAQALSKLPEAPQIRTRVLTTLKERRICDPIALVEMARLQRTAPGETGAKTAALLLNQARSIASERPRDLFGLGQAYASGLATGTPDPKEASDLLHEAAERGHMRAAVALAEVLAEGKLGDRYGEALDWLRRASMAGEPTAVRTLATFADERAGATDVFDKTLVVIRESADAGNKEAMFAYGSILTAAGGRDLQSGTTYLQRAADAGHIAAMKSLARLYASGLIGAASADESTRWTREAAEHGDPEAMFRYSLALDLGFGVATDHQAAIAWHEKARSHGFIK